MVVLRVDNVNLGAADLLWVAGSDICAGACGGCVVVEEEGDLEDDGEDGGDDHSEEQETFDSMCLLM